MSVYLLDINLLVALLWTNHEQHEAAWNWHQSHRRKGWATCPLTQAGFVRIGSDPRIFPDAPPPASALKVLQANFSHPTHTFWKDELPLAKAVHPFSGRLTGHQQTTDAYLFGLAIYKRGVLATFDSSIAALVEEGSAYLKSLVILST